MAPVSAVFKTVVLCISSFTSGSQQGIIGPTLPELGCLFGAGSAEITYILLFMGMGMCTGMMVTPFMLQRLVSSRYCACLSALVCIFFSAFTVSGVNAGFVIVFVGNCASASLINVAVVEISKMWPGNVRMIYVMFASFAVGSVIGPLALVPFVSDGIIVRTYTSSEMSYPEFDHENRTYKTNVTNSLLHSNKTVDPHCKGFITFIEWPYFMFGALLLMLTMLWIYISVKENTSDSECYQTIDETERPNFRKLKCAFVALMVVVFITSQGVYTGYSSLLSTYGVNIDLHLSLLTMTSMTSLFWFCFLIGRVSLAFMPSRIPQLAILISCLSFTLIGLILLCFSSKSEILLWVASVLVGVSSSAMSPVGLAWIGGTIPMTPVLTSVFLSGVGLGFVYPFLGGELMSSIGENTFPYFLHGANAVSVISFIIVYVISKYL